MAKAAARRAGSTSHVWGYVIVLAAGLAFISSMYAMVFSKLLLLPDELAAVAAAPQELDDVVSTRAEQPAVERPSLLQAIEGDVYYCYLVPLTIPVTILACYANWVGLKFFRHN